MKNLRPVIFFLIAVNQKVFTRRLRNVIDDNAILHAESHFPKPYSINNGGARRYQTWGHADYDASDEDDYEYDHRVIFPDTESRETSSGRSQSEIRQCLTTCQPTSEYQLVCGTDGVTYPNLEQMQCFMRCGVDVQIRRLSPCPGWIGTTASPIRTTTSSNMQACMASCPTTSEYNPVCGSDLVTYYNHGKLICAQWCGKDVQVIRRSRCPNVTPAEEPATATTTAGTTTTTGTSARLSSAARSCITSCPSTSEYNPVCGTDRQTYFNLSRLQCAIYCGVDVSLQKSVPCHLQENPNRSSSNNNKDNHNENYDIDIRFHNDA